MATTTIRGVVRGGKIEPVDQLDAPEGTEVKVTVPAAPSQNNQMITRGMFRKKDAHGLSEQDARDMKHMLEREWERSWDRLEKQ